MSIYIPNTSYKALSIIIVNYNSGDLLSRTVNSIMDSNYPLQKIELIVVDNASQDNSLKIAESNIQTRTANLLNFLIIRNNENVGWCKAINQGLAQAKGEIVVFSNHDVIYSEDAISKVVAHLGGDEVVGICQFNSLLPSGEPDVAASYLDPLGYAYSFLVTAPTFVSFGEAVAIAIKKEVVERIGNLDEDYFIEYEDQDYCWRALLCGYKILFVPDAVVHHYRGTVEKPNFFVRGRRVYLYTCNHICTLMKNLETRNLVYYLPQVLLVEFLKALFVLIVKRNFGLAVRIMEGIGAPFRRLPMLWQKRKRVQKIRTLSDREVMKYFVPFMPLHQLNYLKYQSVGKRYVLDSNLLGIVISNK